MKKRKTHEHRVDLRLFLRAKTTVQAEAIAVSIRKLIEQEMTDNLGFKISYTGHGIDVTDLDVPLKAVASLKGG